MLKRLLLSLTVLAIFLSAAPSGVAQIFAVPTQGELNDNPEYWAGYAMGEMVASALVQDPSCMVSPTFSDYRFKVVNPVLKAPINSRAVGFNEALMDYRNYRWLVGWPHNHDCATNPGPPASN